MNNKWLFLLKKQLLNTIVYKRFLRSLLEGWNMKQNLLRIQVLKQQRAGCRGTLWEAKVEGPQV